MHPYVLSRVFSGTFHMNFNQYVNKVRLEYAVGLLMNTDDSVTEVYLDAGFDSQHLQPGVPRKLSYEPAGISEEQERFVMEEG